MRADDRPFILLLDAITPKTQKPLPESIVFEIIFVSDYRLKLHMHPDLPHVSPSQYAKTGSTSSAFSCEGCASCLCLMKNQVLEPMEGKTGGFPSYFRLSATATATATVAPTMGLLPIEIRRFIRQKPIVLFYFSSLFRSFLYLSVSFFIPTFFITLLLFFSGWQMVDNSHHLS